MQSDIDIDMDKQCTKCGEMGACPNGLCLACISKRLRITGGPEEMRRRMNLVRHELGSLALHLVSENVAQILVDLAKEREEHPDTLPEITLKFALPVVMKSAGKRLMVSGSLEWTRKTTRKSIAEGVEIDFEQQELDFTPPDTPNTDDLLEAEKIIRETGRATVSGIQRRMHIGYKRASEIMDALEAAGVVGPPQGSAPREILPEKAA